MMVCDVVNMTEKGSVFRFSDNLLPDKIEMFDSLPFRFLAVARNLKKTKMEGQKKDLWDGFLLAHPLTKGRVGQNVISLFDCLSETSIFDWQILLQCPTTMDINKGEKVLQLSRKSIDKLALQIDKKNPRDSKTEMSLPILQAYIRFSLTLRASASSVT